MLLFELLDGNADRRLGEAQSFGCMRKASEVRGFEKNSHLFEGHGISSIFGGLQTRTFGVGARSRAISNQFSAALAWKPVNRPASDEFRSSPWPRRTPVW